MLQRLSVSALAFVVVTITGCDLLFAAPPAVVEGRGRDRDRSEGEGEEGEGEEGEGEPNLPPDIQPHPQGPHIQSIALSQNALSDNDTATLTVVVTDPDGTDDIVGPLLIEPISGTTLGTLTQSAPGTFTASISWGTWSSVDPVEFSAATGDVRFIRAQFSDNAAHSVTATERVTVACDGGAPACDSTCGFARCPGQDNRCLSTEGNALDDDLYCAACNVGCASCATGCACFDEAPRCSGSKCIITATNDGPPEAPICTTTGALTLRNDGFLSWVVGGSATAVNLETLFSLPDFSLSGLGAQLCEPFGGLELVTRGELPSDLRTAKVVAGIEEGCTVTTLASCEPILAPASAFGSTQGNQLLCNNPIGSVPGGFNEACGGGESCAGDLFCDTDTTCQESCSQNSDCGSCAFDNPGGCRCDLVVGRCEVGAAAAEGDFGQACIGGVFGSCNGGNLGCDNGICQEFCSFASDCVSCQDITGGACTCNGGTGLCEGGGGNVGEGSIRLVAGAARSGRVEIFLNGAFGTVCDDQFDAVEAGVVCRQLGFTGGAVSAFGAGTGTIQLDDLVCTGSESRLVDCGHRAIGTSDCTHSEDVGVICQ